jgi:hypothetical protein
MRRPPILPLILGLSLWGCSDAVDPPSDDAADPPSEGILAVSTSTSGDDPDPDGFQLTIGGIDSLALLPSGTAELDPSPGQYTLQLLGVAEQCSVLPGTSVEVDITAGSTTSVVYDVDCPLTGARITVTTTNGDLDVDGYSVEVDGTDRGVVLPNGALAVRLDPGSRTVTLTGLPPNCTIDGPASRRVTIVDNEAVPIEFAVVCTGSRTIRLDILNYVYPDMTPYIPVQVTLDGKVHDIQVPLGSSTFYFGGLGRGMHSLAAQFRRYPTSEWIHCQRHPGWNGPPVSTIEADTTGVQLELVSTVHCHFR